LTCLLMAVAFHIDMSSHGSSVSH